MATATGSHGQPRAATATGGHGRPRPRVATGGHGRPRAATATGGHGRPRSDHYPATKHSIRIADMPKITPQRCLMKAPAKAHVILSRFSPEFARFI